MGESSLAFILFCLAIILIWQAVAEAGFWPDYIFPSPAGVLFAIIHGIGDESFLHGTIASLKRMALGFGLALMIGVALGVGISQSRLLERTLGTLVLGLQTLPSICWLPLALLWFGLNDKAIIFVVVMGAVGSITMAISSGISNVPPIYVNAARTMGARGWSLFSEVIFPAALPTMVSGARQGWSFAWRSLMAGELLYVSAGLGLLLQMGRELNDINQVVAVMLVIMTIGFLIERLFFTTIEEDVRRKWGLGKRKA
ncbi:ABC transporter permease [Candidatus Micrarchaeota archaeon]|nr:ABC transporter permease [Candidatus Micrarchaeota archaeon]